MVKKNSKIIICMLVAALCGYPAISKASDTIQAYLFPSAFYVNGAYVELPNDYEILNYQEHAYVPIRFITEYLNGKVTYDESAKEIALNVSSFSSLPKNYTKEMAEKNKDIIVNSAQHIIRSEKLFEFLGNKDAPSWIRITRFTVEGDAIVQELRRTGDVFDYFYDSSRDQYGDKVQYITSGTSISERKLNDKGLYEYTLEGASFPKQEEIVLIRAQK